jgi:hypothetical protein
MIRTVYIKYVFRNSSIAACVFVAEVTFFSKPFPSNNTHVYTQSDWKIYEAWNEVTGYKHVPNFMKVGLLVKKLMRQNTDTQRA